MSSNERHKRKNRDRAGDGRPRAKIARALAAGVAFVAGVQAYGVPIRSDNPAHDQPGHFEWQPTAPQELGPGLNPLLPAALQTGASDQSPGVEQIFGTAGPGTSRLQGEQLRFWATSISAGRALIPFAEGELIDFSGGTTQPYIYPDPSLGPMLLPTGVETYVGFNWDHNGVQNRGWIGVVVDPMTHLCETFAWGYETEPGVPIAAGAPEPGTLALLTLGVAATALRRRKSA